MRELQTTPAIQSSVPISILRSDICTQLCFYILTFLASLCAVGGFVVTMTKMVDLIKLDDHSTLRDNVIFGVLTLFFTWEFLIDTLALIVISMQKRVWKELVENVIVLSYVFFMAIDSLMMAYMVTLLISSTIEFHQLVGVLVMTALAYFGINLMLHSVSLIMYLMLDPPIPASYRSLPQDDPSTRFPVLQLCGMSSPGRVKSSHTATELSSSATELLYQATELLYQAIELLSRAMLFWESIFSSKKRSRPLNIHPFACPR